MSPDKSAKVTNELLLETLKAIQGTLTRLVDDIHEVKERLGILKMQYASLSNRMDRMDLRIERIQRRLGLVEVGQNAPHFQIRRTGPSEDQVLLRRGPEQH
jgi:hypothetical protein